MDLGGHLVAHDLYSESFRTQTKTCDTKEQGDTGENNQGLRRKKAGKQMNEKTMVDEASKMLPKLQ